MNKINPINPSTSYRGLVVNGAVSGENINKLGKYASQIENINFIAYLEKSMNVDAILNKDITQMSFTHRIYGNLSGNFGCKSYPLENIFRDATEVIKDIKAATAKAAKDWEKAIAEKDAARRGC